jgi:hypothetical protein
MRLRAWSHASREVEFDPETGSAEVVVLSRPRPDGGAVVGFAGFERSLLGRHQVFAPYRSGDALFFSAGPRRWQLGQPGLAFSHTHPVPLVSRFRVLESGRVVGEPHDFFLAFVAENAASPSWQRHIEAPGGGLTAPGG